MCLLAQINPLKHPHLDDDETRTIQLHHAHQVCGIVANTKDQGVSSVAIHSLAIAGCVLTDPRQQNEVIAILTRIYRNTAWNLNKVVGELRKAWGWDVSDMPPAGGAAAPGSGGPLPAPAHAPAAAPPMASTAQISTLGGSAAATGAMNPLFGPRDLILQTQGARRPSQSYHHPQQQQQQQQPSLPPPPPPQLLLPQPPPSSFASAAATADRHRQLSLASSNTCPTTLTPTQSSFTTILGGGGGGCDGSINSTQASPANNEEDEDEEGSDGSGNVHTPGSASSTAGNAATPPSSSGPMVNPLLAQADFNQPNHPYREWYKPPEKGGHNWFGSSGGGAWPY